jgi:putative colanic acid biosynthesis UDP-glucose lipid carrier transferase
MRAGKIFLLKTIGIIIDVLIMNTVFLLVYYCMTDHVDTIISQRLGEILLLLNGCYFVAFYIVPINLSKRIRFSEKVIKRASLFVFLHLILFVSSLLFLSFYVENFRFIFIFYTFFYFIFCLWRVTVRRVLKAYRKAGHNVQHVIIVGGRENANELYEEIITQDYYGCKVLGIFDDDESVRENFREYKGSIADVEPFCREHEVNEIYCTLPSSEDGRIIRLLEFSEKNMIRFYIVPEFYRYIKRKLTLRNIYQVPVVAIRDEPLQYWYNRLLKRLFDVLFSLLILSTFCLAMYIVLGILIKLSSSGPVIFKQRRTGLYGKEFFCYKFRSMALSNDADEKQAVKNDPRVTKIGEFIRKTNLDEFPQFFNVLKNDMSIVGPRPHMLKHTEEYSKQIDKYMVRHLVKPGVTGWAQVTGFRGETQSVDQMNERVKRDVWYIENWSVLLDIKIIFRTVAKIFLIDKNAY